MEENLFVRRKQVKVTPLFRATGDLPILSHILTPTFQGARVNASPVEPTNNSSLQIQKIQTFIEIEHLIR